MVVLPAYNESKVLAETLKNVRAGTDACILVVDDGSVDNTREVAEEAGARAVRHVINLGLGAAIETGLDVARREGFDRLVTFDADGQHNPDDLENILDALGDSDIVIGVREVHAERMPWVKKAGNLLLNILTALVFGVYSRDSQSGLRAFNRRAIELISVRANRYEVSSEILYEARRNKLTVKEVPVEAIYTEHSIGRGTGVIDGFKILWRMILHNRGE